MAQARCKYVNEVRHAHCTVSMAHFIGIFAATSQTLATIGTVEAAG